MTFELLKYYIGTLKPINIFKYEGVVLKLPSVGQNMPRWARIEMGGNLRSRRCDDSNAEYGRLIISPQHIDIRNMVLLFLYGSLVLGARLQ